MEILQNTQDIPQACNMSKQLLDWILMHIARQICLLEFTRMPFPCASKGYSDDYATDVVILAASIQSIQFMLQQKDSAHCGFTWISLDHICSP